VANHYFTKLCQSRPLSYNLTCVRVYSSFLYEIFYFLFLGWGWWSGCFGVFKSRSLRKKMYIKEDK